MHLGIPALLDFYRIHREEDSLVLATIIGTEGSTYRKPGAMMLIGRDGDFEGMISGGCLEGDLLQHAMGVFASGEPAFVTYDMHSDEELVWGLGLGCDGVIHLMLQRLDRADGFGFLEQLDDSHRDRRQVLLSIALQSGKGLSCGAFALLDSTDMAIGNPELLQNLRTSASSWPDWRFRRDRMERPEGSLDTIQVHMPPQTRVLICGAGPDAVPLALALRALDWDVQLNDHRPAFAREDRFPGCRVACGRPERLAESVDLAGLDAAVIMSHHLENDAFYLRQLAAADLPYIGLLGPTSRRERLRDMADCGELVLYGPAGLDIGAELPASIALSIAAEIHAVLNQRNGLPLIRKTDG